MKHTQPNTESTTKAEVHKTAENLTKPVSTIQWPPKWNNHVQVNTALPIDLARIPIFVGKSHILTLLDTGSSISLIPKRMLLACHLGLIRTTETTCISLTGHSVPIEGIVQAEVTIHNTTVQHPLFVMDKDTSDFILGTDLMARFQNWNLELN